MNLSEFKAHYEHEIRPNPRREALQEIAKKYHERCEAFDLIVCGGISPRTGVAMPTDGYEMREINRNALIQVRAAKEQGTRLGFSPDEILKAIREYRD